MNASEPASVDLGPVFFSIDAASFSSLPPVLPASSKQGPQPQPQASHADAAKANVTSSRTDAGGRNEAGGRHRAEQQTAPAAVQLAPVGRPTSAGEPLLQLPRDEPISGHGRGHEPAALSADRADAAGHEESEPGEGSWEGAKEADSPKPVWEVDRLRWPAICQQLIDQESDYFAHAGEKLFDASRQGLKVLAVTSSRPGEGCTSLAICLARAATASGARVALIDADLPSPQLTASLGLHLAHTWRDVVSGKVPWSEAAVACLEDGLTVFPAAPSPRETHMLAGSTADAAAVLRRVSRSFDMVVLDLGPLRGDVRYLLGSGSSCGVDAAIVVRDCRQTSQQETLTVASRLKTMGVQAVGIAENFTPRHAATAAA